MLAFILVLGMIGSESSLAAADASKPPIAAGSSAGAPSAQTPAGRASWTVLVYVAGDNDLEAAALDDLQEIATIGSSDQVKIAAQVDRVSSLETWDSTAAGNWESTKRLLVTPGMSADAWASAEDLGELNTGDPLALADFITWGVTSYPAERYALIIWSHGAAWQGLARDNTSGGDSLTLPELNLALALARSRAGYGTLNLIGFDACLMAQIDVFQTIAPYAQVAVASAEFEPVRGWAWDAWLGSLAASPGQDAYAIAPVIVDSYIGSTQGASVDNMTLAAFDLSRVNQITSRLAHLTETMLDQEQLPAAALAQARSRVELYAQSRAEEFSAVDLGHLAQLLSGEGPTGEAAADLVSAIERARLAFRAGPRHPNASGMSVYFPPSTQLYLADYERESPLPRLTRWAELLTAYHRAAAETRLSP